MLEKAVLSQIKWAPSVCNINFPTSFHGKHYFLIGQRMNSNKLLEASCKKGKKVFSRLTQICLLCFWKHSENTHIIFLPWSTARQMWCSRQNIDFNWFIPLAFSLQFLPVLFNNCTCVTIWKHFGSLVPQKSFGSCQFAMAHFAASAPTMFLCR